MKYCIIQGEGGEGTEVWNIFIKLRSNTPKEKLYYTIYSIHELILWKFSFNSPLKKSFLSSEIENDL